MFERYSWIGIYLPWVLEQQNFEGGNKERSGDSPPLLRLVFYLRALNFVDMVHRVGFVKLFVNFFTLTVLDPWKCGYP